MAKQTVNIGTSVNDGSGDPARTAFNKLNLNNNEIYNYLGDGTNLNKLGTAAFKNTGTQAGNVMEVGEFGLGNGFQILYNTISTPSQMPVGLNLSTATTDKLGILANANWQATSLLSLRAYPDQSLGSTNHVQAAFFGSRLFLRGGAGSASGNNTLTAWAEVRSTANTTVDGNGFIKAASPIVKLFADKIELNNEAQQQDIAFEKLGIGEYLIKGSSGFAQEGWYVETPKDANGNLLVAVVYEQLANGDISVKTYDYMLNKKGRIVADTETPLDVPENRWIDIRLQELPRPEIEVTDEP